MKKTVELLLVDSVDGLGIVGDVVNVRLGYARNFLLPRALATTPSEQLIKELAGRRADAQRVVAEQRASREAMVEKLEGVEVALERSCNDLGHLYGSVTQQDIAKALIEQGFAVKARDVRLNQTIKRVGDYEIHVKPESDLEAVVKLHVKADRPLELDQVGSEPAGAVSENLPAPEAPKEAKGKKGEATAEAAAAPADGEKGGKKKGDKKGSKAKQEA